MTSSVSFSNQNDEPKRSFFNHLKRCLVLTPIFVCLSIDISQIKERITNTINRCIHIQLRKFTINVLLLVGFGPNLLYGWRKHLPNRVL